MCNSYVAPYPCTSSKLFTDHYLQHTRTHKLLLSSSTEHSTLIHAAKCHQ